MRLQSININTGFPVNSINLTLPAATAPSLKPGPIGFQGSLAGFEMLPGFANFGNAPAGLGAINSGFLGVPYQSPLNSVMGTMTMMMMLQQMIALMSQFVGAATGGSGMNGAGLGFPGMYQNGNSAPRGVVGMGGGGGNGNVAAPSASAGAPAGTVAPTNAAAPSNGSGASPVRIGPGTKVLEIGDSHSVGAFGHELDAKLRGTGAQVATYASAGATASTFVQGKSTRYGYWEKGADGTERTVGYGKTAQTPRLDSLIAKEKPHVIVVNLGANFRGSNPKSQVDQLGQVAKKYGIPIVWVGPPKTAKDASNPGSLARFDQEMAQAVAPYGKYVSSNQPTPQYSGGDGIHYGGSKGTQLAKNWANGVFRDIVG